MAVRLGGLDTEVNYVGPPASGRPVQEHEQPPPATRPLQLLGVGAASRDQEQEDRRERQLMNRS